MLFSQTESRLENKHRQGVGGGFGMMKPNLDFSMKRVLMYKCVRCKGRIRGSFSSWLMVEPSEKRAVSILCSFVL